MFKLAIGTECFARVLTGIPVIRKFVAFRFDRLDDVEDLSLRTKLYSYFVTVEGPAAKITAVGRFRELDEIGVKLLPCHHNELQIHDVAVSSGITALELFDRISTCKMPFSYFVSDRYSRYIAKQSALATLVYDTKGELIIGYIMGLVADPRLSWKFIGSKLLFFVCRLIRPSDVVASISLFEPRLQDLISSKKISEIDYDVFLSRLPPRFTFVRCMNLLNPGYFSDEQLRLGVANLWGSLLDGGIFQIGRTLDNGEHRASFFRKEGRSAVHLVSIGGGSEIQSLVLQEASLG